MPELSNITPLAVVVILIILTDRWILRIFRVLVKHLERRELADQQMILYMVQCSESLVTIKDSLSPPSLPADTKDDKLAP